MLLAINWHLLGVSGDYLAVGKLNERDANVANCEKGNEKGKEVMKVYFGIAFVESSYTHSLRS